MYKKWQYENHRFASIMEINDQGSNHQWMITTLGENLLVNKIFTQFSSIPEQITY